MEMFSNNIMWALLYAAEVAYFIIFTINVSNEKTKDFTKYKPFVLGNSIPFFVLIFVILHIDDPSFRYNACFKILPVISIYYTILIIFSSHLRNILEKRTMTVLWLMPSLLIFYLIHVQDFIPLLVIHVNKKILDILLIIWFSGFILVLTYHTITHLLFRKKLISNSIEVNDPFILSVWEEELKKTKTNKNYPVVRNNLLSSPLTIGMFNKTTIVVLPKLNYTYDELKLIFRHELMHIMRNDVGAKFFIVFCKALCWYNPFMWIAMKKCSEDIELSCDEDVLLEEDINIRKLYADVVLKSADSETGYTSCLSAKATSLLYRIKNILNPKSLKRGSFMAATVFFVLCMCTNTYALTYDEFSGLEAVYQDANINDYTEIKMDYNISHYPVDITVKEFNDYIKNYEFEEISMNYLFTEHNNYYIQLNDNEQMIRITIHENIMKVKYNNKNKFYYCREKINFDDFTVKKKPFGF